MANEKRLIDANALMDAFRRYMVERHDRERCASEEHCKLCERGCLWRNTVMQAPTVDAVEVVHGRWIWTMTGEEDYEQYYRCSECNDYMYSEYNYCPNCGAKMDGDGNG